MRTRDKYKDKQTHRYKNTNKELTRRHVESYCYVQGGKRGKGKEPKEWDASEGEFNNNRHTQLLYPSCLQNLSIHQYMCKYDNVDNLVV